ncbi:uncharacterized protein LOC123317894 [Coccinella septempunctata]|uniref:uncharacterized protein LOC123317894 n=1 Tax=Coccinella septempunctata TaxID=41139 RepID=UPI001D06014B|nr:uncharacterized protein LOC123317894 [Coccinella septempunctata]
MDDFKDLFESRHHKRSPYDHGYGVSERDKYNRYSYRETKHDPQYRSRFERENFHLSQSTLCVPHHCKNPSKSTICMPFPPISPSKSTLCPPKKFTKPIMDDDVTSLPYYIVPVLYVPHKPLYDAKQVLEPHIYKAYHCKSKNQLHKDTKHPTKLSDSKTLLNIYNKKHSKKGYDYPYVSKSDKYSFECYDEYFRKCIEEKRSSSDISFCTEKSYCHLPVTPKLSSKFEQYSSEKRKSIPKDFPELFGLHTSRTTNFTFGPRAGEELPTWDSPRTTDALIETEMTVKSCISAQTSFDTLRWRRGVQDDKIESQGTQTDIMDIKKNVLVLPNDKFKRSVRRQPIPEEVPKSIYDRKTLNPQFSEGHLDKVNPKAFVSSNIHHVV